MKWFHHQLLLLPCCRSFSLGLTDRVNEKSAGETNKMEKWWYWGKREEEKRTGVVQARFPTEMLLGPWTRGWSLSLSFCFHSFEKAAAGLSETWVLLAWPGLLLPVHQGRHGHARPSHACLLGMPSSPWWEESVCTGICIWALCFLVALVSPLLSCPLTCLQWFLPYCCFSMACFPLLMVKEKDV